MWKDTYTALVTAWAELAELAHPGDSIRERRIELGWTQAELSKRSGVPQADISRIENGRLDARWSTIQRLSAALTHRDGPPRRSLANGRKVAAAPSAGGTKWSPKGRNLEIPARDE
jgi:transcriptional regulator with XRE-family HTH domain